MNLSGRTVTSCRFAEELEAAFDRHGADPRRLTFEITETAPAFDDRGACAVVERIAGLDRGQRGEARIPAPHRRASLPRPRA